MKAGHSIDKREVCIWGTRDELVSLGNNLLAGRSLEIETTGDLRYYPVKIRQIKFLLSKDRIENRMEPLLSESALTFKGNLLTGERWGQGILNYFGGMCAPETHLHIDDFDGELLAMCGISFVIGIDNEAAQ